jgi:1-acyl-sn-glycerol-3-phosphate acyltransferase
VNPARTALAVTLFVLFVVLIAGPGLWLILLLCRIRRSSPRIRRKKASAWQVRCCRIGFGFVAAVMGVRADFRLPVGKGPFLVIVNHRSSFDLLLVSVLLARMGENDGRPMDMLSVRRAAKRAVAEGGNIVIFPEGTRFTGSRNGSGYAQVLPPKTGGFTLLKEMLTGHRILSVTIDWEGGVVSKTIFDAAAYAGRRVVVEAEVADVPASLPPAAWLEAEWAAKDRRLSGKEA